MSVEVGRHPASVVLDDVVAVLRAHVESDSRLLMAALDRQELHGGVRVPMVTYGEQYEALLMRTQSVLSLALKRMESVHTS